jgi:hypothetical protein
VSATDRGYALQNAWDKERRRLTLLEDVLDPTTIGLLRDLGVGPGRNVLEVIAADVLAEPLPGGNYDLCTSGRC